MHFVRIAICIFCACSFSGARADASIGPIYEEFSLTLAPGKRTEAAGPLFYSEQKESQQQIAVPPLFSRTYDPDVEAEEIDILYPLLTYDRFGGEYRFQIVQLFAFSGGKTQNEQQNRRFTLFPVYFEQRSKTPEFNYTAVFPFYGTLKNRLFRDEIHFAAFPLYARTIKKDVVTTNYVYPIFHLRQGDAMHGWQFWPLVGMEQKQVTQRTNRYDEIEILGGYDKRFVLWPVFLKNTTGIGTENPSRELSVLPLFTTQHSPKRDSFSSPWPLGLTVIDDREKNYHEVGCPWPFIVFAHGEGKNTSRIWPFYSQAATTNLQSKFYLWPIYKVNRLKSPPLERERTRILFFLYSDLRETNLETKDQMRRVDFLPFYTFRRDLEGKQRLQVLSLLEPFLPTNKSVERDYSPLWSLWRSEKNPKTKASSQSLLWNLYRRDMTPSTTKTSALFGMVQHESSAQADRWRLFYIPFGREPRNTASMGKP